MSTNLVWQLIIYYWLIFCNNNFSWPEFFKVYISFHYGHTWWYINLYNTLKILWNSNKIASEAALIDCLKTPYLKIIIFGCSLKIRLEVSFIILTILFITNIHSLKWWEMKATVGRWIWWMVHETVLFSDDSNSSCTCTPNLWVF